jgi:hypothetical protein
VKDVLVRIFDVDQYGVVFRRPTRFGFSTVVVGPDDFVEKTLTPEHSVKEHFCVVHFSIIEVKVQSAVVSQQPPCFFKPRGEKAPVLCEVIII